MQDSHSHMIKVANSLQTSVHCKIENLLSLYTRVVITVVCTLSLPLWAQIKELCLPISALHLTMCLAKPDFSNAS